ncbi:MAG TPA: hypothetical protein VMD98_05520 [Bryocella sp.]|nr:hypothetical protein [Bryocella sp.]
MRRWYLPLTVLGLSGIGALLLTERGRSVLRRALERFWDAPEQLLDWNGSLENELDRIQDALDTIAESLNPRPELSH